LHLIRNHYGGETLGNREQGGEKMLLDRQLGGGVVYGARGGKETKAVGGLPKLYRGKAYEVEGSKKGVPEGPPRTPTLFCPGNEDWGGKSGIFLMNV